MESYEADQMRSNATLLWKWARLFYLFATLTSIGGSVALISASGVTFDIAGIIVASVSITACSFVSFGIAIVLVSTLNILAQFAFRAAEQDEARMRLETDRRIAESGADPGLGLRNQQ